MEIYKNPPNLKTLGNIGIMGGAFNPIHYGHLAAAEAVRLELELDLVLFIPTGRHVHKPVTGFGEHRYLMTLLATADNPHFFTSRMELDRPGATYTVDTLRILRKNTDARLTFIVGADEIMKINSWKEPEALKTLCDWAVVTRPGYTAESPNFPAKIIKTPMLDISSTDLRGRGSIKYLTPPHVERYVREMKGEDLEPIQQAVAGKLSPSRYEHTLGVIETAVLLSARHGVNFRKAYLAALLHDYAKEYSENEKRALCREFGLVPDEVQDGFINLMHGPLSAEMARKEFGITDEEILNPIIYHTTGRAGMSPLEYIIKIADNVEMKRPQFPGIDAIRALSADSLEKGAAASIRRDIEYTESKGRIIHSWGKEALKHLEGAI